MNDEELPGMWENADFTGGATDSESSNNMTDAQCTICGSESTFNSRGQIILRHELRCPEKLLSNFPLTLDKFPSRSHLSIMAERVINHWIKEADPDDSMNAAVEIADKLTKELIKLAKDLGNPTHWVAVFYGEDAPLTLDHGNILTINGTGQVLIKYRWDYRNEQHRSLDPDAGY